MEGRRAMAHRTPDGKMIPLRDRVAHVGRRARAAARTPSHTARRLAAARRALPGYCRARARAARVVPQASVGAAFLIARGPSRSERVPLVSRVVRGYRGNRGVVAIVVLFAVSC